MQTFLPCLPFRHTTSMPVLRECNWQLLKPLCKKKSCWRYYVSSLVLEKITEIPKYKSNNLFTPQTVDYRMFEGLKSLKDLRMSSNMIATMESKVIVKNCPVLKYLDISDNLLTALELKLPKFVDSLNISSNRLLKEFITGNYSLPVSVLDVRSIHKHDFLLFVSF